MFLLTIALILQSVTLSDSFKLIDYIDSKAVWGFAPISENRLVFYNSLEHEIVSMDVKTKEFQKFGRKGRGPKEFLNVSQIVNYNDTLYIMDIDTDRLTLLTKDLKFIKSQNFEDFIPFHFGVTDDYLVARSSNQFNNANIHILSRDDLSYIRSFPWPFDDEKWNNTLYNTGQIFAKGNFGYYSGSISNKFIKINLDTLSYQVTRFRNLPDPEFELEESRQGRLRTRIRKEYTFTGMQIAAFQDLIVVGYSGTKFGNYYYLDFYNQELEFLKSIEFEHPIYDFAIYESTLFVCAYGRNIETSFYTYELNAE